MIAWCALRPTPIAYDISMIVPNVIAVEPIG